MEAINDAVTWAMRKGGVNSVLYLSDRARHEFSNASMMMWLSHNENKFFASGEPMITEPDHGKSDCAGLGAGIKTMLYEWFISLERMSTSTECVQYLWDHTKGVPIRARYAKHKAYRFKMVEGKQPTTPSTGTIRGITKLSHWNQLVSPSKSWPDTCHVFVTFASQNGSMHVATRGMRGLGNKLT